MSNLNVLNQISREQQSIDSGRTAYHNNLSRMADNGQAHNLKPLSYSANPFIEALATGIEEQVTKGLAVKSNRKPVFAKLLAEADPQVLARLTISEVLTQSLKKNKKGEYVSLVNATAASIGRRLDTERMNEILFGQNKKEYTRLVKQNLPAGKLYERLSRIKDVDGLQAWSDENRMTIGGVLVELVFSAGIASKGSVSIKKKMNSSIDLCPQIAERLATSVEKESLLQPSLTPMVVRPLEWSNTVDGGYITLRHNLVKRYVDDKHQLDVATKTSQAVLDGINAAQNTGWQINTVMLEVIQYCLDNKVDITDLWAEGDKNKTRALRLQAHSAIEVAKGLLTESAFYFPHSMDHRGRLYPLPANLNPQSSGPIKSLLKFSEGVALNESSAFWLAVHISNTYGNDKVSLQDRVDFVNSPESMDLFSSIVDDIYGTIDVWSKMDDCFNFLAAICEYVAYKRGELVISRVCIALDGSINGYQHMAALLHDAAAGKSVNLIPNLPRQDLYMDVASIMATKLPELADKSSRKLVKRPVMTMGYGAKKNGMASQIAKEDQSIEWDDARILGDTAFDTIGEVCPSVTVLRDWTQAIAADHASLGESVRWTTPDGLPVAHKEVKQHTVRPKFIIDGEVHKMRINVATNTVDKNAMKNGISPNVIHSLDACHLRMVAAQSAIEDSPIGLIHDSFSTNADNAGRLFDLVREQFVAIYEQDVLGSLAKSFGVTSVPTKGTLDIQQILNTEYSFA